jgi:ABC-type branched-subunit amino acid transport system permease subunit
VDVGNEIAQEQSTDLAITGDVELVLVVGGARNLNGPARGSLAVAQVA